MGCKFLAFLIATIVILPSAFAGHLLKLNSATIDTSKTSAVLSDVTDLNRSTSEFIVQFTNKIQESDKAEINRRFMVFGYLPDDALVVRGVHEDLLFYKRSHPQIRTILKYSPQFKISSELNTLNVFNKDEVISLTIHIFRASESSKILRQLLQLNPQVELEDIQGAHLVISSARKFIPQIAALKGVEHLEATPHMELYDFSVNDAQASSDYSTLTGFEDGTKVIGMSEAWSQGFTGKNQIVAMADTGVDSGDTSTIIPDLQGAIKDGAAFGLRATSWMDPMGHGTHVAGLLVGRGTLSGRVVKSSAHDAMLVAEGMWSPIVKNMTVPSQLSVLFDKAYQSGARIHSNSWGSNNNLGAYDTSAAQVDEWMFKNPDMLVVFAAGNNGSDMDKDGRVDGASLGSPGTAKNCLTVGASKNRVAQGGVQGPLNKMTDGRTLWSAEPLASSTMSDTETGLAPFSSRGPTRDGRLKPDIVAPGTNILSTKSHQQGASSLWGFFNKDYTWSGGTSMAAPLAASAVTVARQVLVEKWGFVNPSAALMKAFMIHSAEDLYPGQFGEIGQAKGQEILTRRPNMDEGYGRVNMANLVNLGEGTHLIDERKGIAQDQVMSYEFTVKQSADLYANLVWTDAPASANAAVALVNDLDLELTFPDGHVLASEDHVNNLEKIEISGLMPGTYKLVIRGFRIPQGINGLQPFAFIYTVREH
ncbi:MAG TPA: S8 family serine peptidase [Bdellovibrio sp.]|uniref:S8 family serine peptidase n=1 Tax=Bdellovibrio sp. TaxID=28201 RepID=UPI002F069F3B